MKIAFIITARTTSSRLPKKHLKRVLNKPLLQYLIDRIELAFAQEIAQDKAQVVIASGSELENGDFIGFETDKRGVFFGPNHNIPLRHLAAANCFLADAIISVDGDDILCAIEAIKAVYEALQSGADYVTTSGLALGLNVGGYQVPFLREALANTKERRLEVGWHRIFNQDLLKTLVLSQRTYPEALRFTLDYPEDLQFFEQLLTLLGPNYLTATADQMVDCALSHHLEDLTAPIAQVYWDRYNAEKAAEAAAYGHS